MIHGTVTPGFRRRLCVLAVACCPAVLAGCSDGPAEPAEPAPLFVVSGTVENRNGATIPANARIITVWEVSSGEDYAYVFGEGTLDRDAGTFRVEFDAPPPAAALNAYGLGVGFIVLTTNQEVGPGDDPNAIAEEELLGAAGLYGVIFIDGDPAEVAEVRTWADDFPEGYSVGRGITIPDSPFDGFEPVDAGSVELIIDDLENIEFVNWT